MMRLNKFIAHAGVCSRRKAADLVKAGKVKVNGEVEINPSYETKPDDQIEYDGRVLKIEDTKRYIILNKPKQTVTTLSDEQGRRTVMDIIKNKVTERVYPVGRLDFNTTGLLLITNDGDLAKKLTHPSHGVKKIYQVELDRELEEKHLLQIQAGIELEDGLVKVDKIDYVKDHGKEMIGVEIHIGKNRIVRRIFEHFDYSIIRLDRVYFGGLTKKDLPRGWHRELTEEEIRMLKHFV